MTTFTFNDKKYELKRKTTLYGDYDELISSDAPSALLSKYFALDDRSITSFIENKIYATHRTKFNDIFDSNLMRINLMYINDHDFIERIQRLWKDSPEVQDDLIGLLNKDRIAFERKFKLRFAQTIFDLKFGFFCMIKDTESQLMWSHYTNNCGFLVQYDNQSFPENFSQPLKIEYFENESAQLFPQTLDDLFICMQITSSSKRSVWKYENEYRIIIQPQTSKSFKFSEKDSDENLESRIQKIPKKSVKKVILGHKFLDPQYTSQDKEWYKVKLDSCQLQKKLIDHLINEEISTEMIYADYENCRIRGQKIEFTINDKGTYQYRECQ